MSLHNASSIAHIKLLLRFLCISKCGFPAPTAPSESISSQIDDFAQYRDAEEEETAHVEPHDDGSVVLGGARWRLLLDETRHYHVAADEYS